MHSPTITVALLYSALITLLIPTSSQTCQTTCGPTAVKYPFGTGTGCGDPRFNPSVTCTKTQQLTLSTHTGSYTITSIDYTNKLLRISDPTMSTCQCTRPSPGFSLDWNAPFSFHDNTLFALFGCSAINYTSCDPTASDICNLLTSCNPAVSRIDLPNSGCCVYAPVDLGPSFGMDLGNLQCQSYSAVWGYKGQEYTWEYGIELEYKFNYNNDYPEMCAICEKSNGVCGYGTASYKPFLCNCPDGFNTSTGCFFGQNYSYSTRIPPVAVLGYALAWFFVSSAFI